MKFEGKELKKASSVFLKKARKMYPKMYSEEFYPLKETLPGEKWMRCGDSFTLDFGTHIVGYIKLKVRCDNVPDSPLKVVFRFAEMPFEFEDYPYTGSLSSSWFQEETVHADNPLKEIALPRRYAFRYVKITFPANTGYRVQYEYCTAESVTSADESGLEPLPENADPFLKQIDAIGTKTLKDCMQSVFEDGPKRDRRLWLGDLYIQAKTNYCTYRNNDLVLRNLYLFAGIPHEDGCLSSAIFQEPMLKNQAWILHDYALFFIGTLYDYYEDTGDTDVLKELWPVAFRQAQIASESAKNNGNMAVPGYYFIDWCEPLDKTLPAQGVLIAMLKCAGKLSEICGTDEETGYIADCVKLFAGEALKYYDSERNLFVTRSGQVSFASQMWMVLAGILPEKENRKVLKAVAECADAVKTVTPYAMHYYTESLWISGMKAKAMDMVKSYWGAMAKLGAECFWEVFVPDNPEASPYGDKRINSYCHAWSCSASYFIRKYYNLQKK